MGILKCVVWDLDHTLWNGVVLESGDVQLCSGVREAVRTLDQAGILQSVASRSDETTALAWLEQLEVAHYFLFPQIGWADKSEGLQRIAERLNLGLDSFVLVDDDPYERAQVAAALPMVRCLPPAEIGTVLAEAGWLAGTGEAASRREMYQAERRRAVALESSGQSPAAFARQLGLHFKVRRLRTEDLDRAHELTVRTHQLNTTGIVYDRSTLDRLRSDPGHLLLAASLSDRFGEYGTIGLAVVATARRVWVLTLLLTSCRVVSRGAGSLLLGDVQRRACRAGAQLEAELVPTDRNRMMTVALRFAGFQPRSERRGDRVVFVAAAPPAPVPAYITLRSEP